MNISIYFKLYAIIFGLFLSEIETNNYNGTFGSLAYGNMILSRSQCHLRAQNYGFDSSF